MAAVVKVTKFDMPSNFLVILKHCIYLQKRKKEKKKEKREKGKGRKEKGEGEGKEIKGEGEGENNNSITHGNLQPVFVCLITDKSFRAGTILVSLIKSFLFSA